MSHRNARLTAHGRRLMVACARAGRPVAHAAAETGISVATAHNQPSERRAARRPAPETARAQAARWQDPAGVGAAIGGLVAARAWDIPTAGGTALQLLRTKSARAVARPATA